MSVRRIALFITTLVLALGASPAVAHAGTPTLSQLRAQLRDARTRLRDAGETLASARTDRREAGDLVEAAGGPPAVLWPAPTGDPAPDGSVAPADPAATDAASFPSTGDPALDALVAALKPSLAGRLLADGAITADEIAALEARVAKWRRIVRRLRRAESELEARIELRLQIAEWNRRGAWRPLIELAARRRGISADGLYRLMMAESGGRRFAGSTFRGLFQYYPGTWRAGWNPWRSQSIYDGWAQIQATAYAIDRGMGPSNWPSTYEAAF